MIGDILKIIANETSKFIDNQIEFPSGKKSVVLHKPNSANGEFNLLDNSISLSLLNIEEELSNKSATVNKRVINGEVYIQNPKIDLNLQIIFISNFPNDYISELNYITKIIQFFQQKTFFTPNNTDGLAELKIYKLNFKLNTLPLETQNNIWSMLGGRYMPSVVYKVGLISIQEKEKLVKTKIVKRVDIRSNQKRL